MVTPIILSVMNQRETILQNATAELSDFMHFPFSFSFLYQYLHAICSHNLNYTDYSYFGAGYTDTYQVGLCFNYTFGDLCAAGITNEVATLICRNRGYSK